MNARICDRCGAAYATQEGKSYKKSNTKYNTITFGSCAWNGTFTKDLCPDCMGYLFDWLKNDSGKEKNNVY